MGTEQKPERDRPNSEELLDRYRLRDSVPPTWTPAAGEAVSADSHRPARGRLRVYLGMAAGVGKTYGMLNEGRRRKARGTDVVIGYVETHHRPITEQQIGDLEIVPRKRIPYRGVTLEEMDVDAVRARHPQVALVDELAHTNAPGSRNAKRYQDVEELLAAGITVISTLNIQHLEGLNDIVEAITDVRQRETLPDRILDEADEVELVDISPDALRARLRHGNIYASDRIQQALDNYFSQSNLTALRELALRRTAEKTESQLEELMRGREPSYEPAWTTTATERVLVAFDAQPHSRTLLREGWRLARGLKAPFLAATVVPPADTGKRTGASMSSALEANMRLAEDLGAEVIRLEGTDVAAQLVRLAQERHVTHVVVGQSTSSRWSELFRGSVVTRLLHAPTGAAIHVLPHKEGDDD